MITLMAVYSEEPIPHEALYSVREQTCDDHILHALFTQILVVLILIQKWKYLSNDLHCKLHCFDVISLLLNTTCIITR